MTRILSIGMGGVGVVANYALQLNREVETTAVIRSDYDKVISEGYTLSSIDYGGRRANGDPNEADNAIKGFRPNKVVKSLAELEHDKPFDFIIVATKVVPTAGNNNIWDEITAHKHHLLLPDRKTGIVLIQNGIEIEQYWQAIEPEVTLISGVSYISSTNDKGLVTQYGGDSVVFGLFEYEQLHDEKAQALLKKFVDLYSNEYNDAKVDHNVRYTRWKKLLYNATYNVVCCLTRKDVGVLFHAEEKHIIESVIAPMMEEVLYIANDDLKKYDFGKYNQYITIDDIVNLNKLVGITNAVDRYKPSMMIDALQDRAIELEPILGNVIGIYKKNNPEAGTSKIPGLALTYNLLYLQHFAADPK